MSRLHRESGRIEDEASQEPFEDTSHRAIGFSLQRATDSCALSCNAPLSQPFRPREGHIQITLANIPACYLRRPNIPRLRVLLLSSQRPTTSLPILVTSSLPAKVRTPILSSFIYSPLLLLYTPRNLKRMRRNSHLS